MRTDEEIKFARIKLVIVNLFVCKVLMQYYSSTEISWTVRQLRNTGWIFSYVGEIMTRMILRDIPERNISTIPQTT